MRDWNALKERYLRDDLPIRLEGIAANLARIKSFSVDVENQILVESIIQESKWFIEWTAKDVEVEFVDEQLKYEPLVETRNRKPMEPNSLATWELRIGNLRVYYDVEENTVSVLADYVRSLGRESAIAAFESKPVAVLVAIADIETVSLSSNARFLEIIERSRQQQKAGKVVSSEEARRKLGLG